jgi:hypothetical protein
MAIKSSDPALLAHISRVGKPLWVRENLPAANSAKVSAQVNEG